MANKPSVTLTLAGDEKRLTEAFDRVGHASKTMADTVGAASKDMASHAKRFDDLAEKSDNVDTRAMGFRDTLTGLQDTMKGLSDPTLSFQDQLLTLGFGIGDLASGFTNVLFPAMSSAATFMKGPLATAMTFISEHPLLITLGLITAAVIFLISQTDWFQNVATRVFNWVGTLVKTVFGASIDWIIDAWNGVLDFFEHLPENIGKALGSMGDWIGGAFKAGINAAVSAINWFVDHTLNWAIDRINDVSGVVGIPPIPHIPPIPKLHTGGTVPGAPGTEVLTLLRAGERVDSNGLNGGGGVLEVRGTGALAELLQALIHDGSLQLVGR